jgi:NHL repeat-containing protein
MSGHLTRSATLAALFLPYFALVGCATGISIVSPSNGSTVALTGAVTAQASIQGTPCNNSFQATLDGVSITQLFSPQPPASSTTQATLPSLVPGDHTLVVRAGFGSGCQASTGTSTFYRIGPPTIYITDGETSTQHNDRVVQVSDMSGAGWTTFGTAGAGTGQFASPRGIYVYSPTRIYVVDELNHRIVLMYDMQGSGWTSLGTSGGGVKQFSDPIGIFLDLATKIYVTDAVTDRIVRMDDMTGAGWITFGSTGSGTNHFRNPAGIFVDSTGKIYVADSSNDRIVRINDMTGVGWTTIGSTGSGNLQFSTPAFIFVDPSNRIYVVDSNNCRIVRMDDMTGAGWTALGTCGNGVGQFNGIQFQMGGIFVDTGGKIYVADGGNSRVVRMDDMTGAGWTTLGSFGSGSNQFIVPLTIFVKPPSLITH